MVHCILQFIFAKTSFEFTAVKKEEPGWVVAQSVRQLREKVNTLGGVHNNCQNTEGIEILKEPSSNYFSNHWLSAVIIDEKVTGFTREQLELLMIHVKSLPSDKEQ